MWPSFQKDRAFEEKVCEWSLLESGLHGHCMSSSFAFPTFYVVMIISISENETLTFFQLPEMPILANKAMQSRKKYQVPYQRCFLQVSFCISFQDPSAQTLISPFKSWKERRKCLSLANQCYNLKPGSASLPVSRGRINLLLFILCSLLFQLEDIKVLLRVLKDKHYMW